MRGHRCFVVCLLFGLAASCLYGQGVPVYVRVMDVATHFAVQAKVEFKGPETLITETDKYGRASVHLSPGQYQERVTAPGYKPMIYQFTVVPGENTLANGRDPRYPTGAMLNRIKQPEEIEEADKLIRPGYTLFTSYAVGEGGQPVGDVHVRIYGKSIEATDATTNARGFFAISVPTPPATTPPVIADTENLPATADLIAEKPGYKTQVHMNIPLMGGGVNGVFLEMVRGSGTVKSDDAPAWLDGTSGTCIGEHACEDVEKTQGHLMATLTTQARPGRQHRKASDSRKYFSAPTTHGAVSAYDYQPFHLTVWKVMSSSANPSPE